MFYTVSQNNSGGSFDHVPSKGIGYAICVEAVTVEMAKARFWEIVGNYDDGGDCPCCGDRWSFYLWDDDDGSQLPTMYDKPLKGGWGIPSYIHYADGRIVAVS